MVRAPSGVLVEQPLDRVGTEPAARARPVAEQHVARERPQLAAEPVRRAEAPKPAFPRAATVVGKLVGERAPQRDLALAAALLQAIGQREPELDDAMVEERRAQLERVRHRRDVGLRQQIAGQVRAQVERLQAGDAAGRGGAEQKPGRRERADLCACVVGPELCALLEREHLHQPPVALGSRARRRRRGSARRGKAASDARRRPDGSARSSRAPDACGGRRDAVGEPHRGVPLVARERLVAAVADERDRHLVARRLADEEERQRRLVAERLVERRGEAWQRRRGVGLEHDLLVTRAVALGDRSRVRALVVARRRRSRR